MYRKSRKPTIKSNYILMGLTLICLILIFLSFTTNMTEGPLKNIPGLMIVPFEKGINRGGEFLGTSASGFQNAKNLAQEKESLEKQLELLKSENHKLLQEQEEAKRLKELIELKDKYPNYEMKGANVIAKGDGNWFATFTIDKGSQDGIQKDMNVISQGGLVGIVADVGLSWATVRSIIDDTAAVSGVVDGGDSFCIISGSLKAIENNVILIQDLTDQSQTAKVGDTIITSQISTKFLPGIKIGTIQTLEEDPNHLTKSGYLIPTVNFNRIDEVLVIVATKEEVQGD